MSCLKVFHIDYEISKKTMVSPFYKSQVCLYILEKLIGHTWLCQCMWYMQHNWFPPFLCSFAMSLPQHRVSSEAGLCRLQFCCPQQQMKLYNCYLSMWYNFKSPLISKHHLGIYVFDSALFSQNPQNIAASLTTPPAPCHQFKLLV